MGGAGEHQGGNSISRVGDVVFGADAVISAWIAAKIPDFSPSKDARALGVIKGDKVVAGVVFERWNGVHVEAAIAAEPGVMWATRGTLHSFFHYPFVTLGCLAISVSVPMSNVASLNLATKLGFESEALVRYAAHDGSPLVILKMFKDRCKWIGDYGQEGRISASATGPQGDGGSAIAV